MLRALRRPISEGWLFLFPLLAAVVVGRRRRGLSAAALVGAAATAAALRDPERSAPVGEAAFAPADGRVVAIERVVDDYFGVEMIEIAIFLALWNVHVQRSPLGGRVIHATTSPGGYRPAMLVTAATNFRKTIYLETAWGPCVVSQIAGIVARRIVRWVEPGDVLAAGQRIGLIKLGSRVSVRLPADVRVLVVCGDEVRAGITPIAERPA